MKKIILVPIAFFALTLNVLAQSDLLKSGWRSQEIMIDGNDRDWKKPLNFYDDQTGLLFAISNDQRNLFLAFTFNNEMKMRKLMNAGWSVVLSSKEKKRKFSASLQFPGVPTAWTDNRKTGDFEKKGAGNSFIKDYQSKIEAILVKGFRSNQTQLHLHDPNGIDIAVGATKAEHIFYEIAIPLTELMDGNFIHLDELITLNVTINAMERPSIGSGQESGRSGRGFDRSEGGMSEMGYGMNSGGRMNYPGGGRYGGSMGGGMSRRGGSMSRGGSYSGNSYDRGGLFERVSFKQKFTLSKD